MLFLVYIFFPLLLFVTLLSSILLLLPRCTCRCHVVPCFRVWLIKSEAFSKFSIFAISCHIVIFSFVFCNESSCRVVNILLPFSESVPLKASVIFLWFFVFAVIRHVVLFSSFASDYYSLTTPLAVSYVVRFHLRSLSLRYAVLFS